MTEEMASMIPAPLRTARYDTYVAKDANAYANQGGVYGLLAEFHSYYYGAKTYAALTKNNYKPLNGDFFAPYEEFKYWILQYLIYSKTRYPAIYNGIMSNGEFLEVYTDVAMRFGELVASEGKGETALRAELRKDDCVSMEKAIVSALAAAKESKKPQTSASGNYSPQLDSVNPPISVPKVGDRIGDVLHTDILAFINGNQIPSCNIAGYMCISVADLRNYGFDVTYNNATRSTTIKLDKGKAIAPLNVAKTVGKIGDKIGNVLYTDIKTYINGKTVTSVNVDGKLAIPFFELKAFGEVNYDNATRSSTLNIR